MFDIIYFLFPLPLTECQYSFIILAFRIIFGVLIILYGVAKASHFKTLSTTFPDPLNIVIKASLSLAIFGELICPLAFMLGFLYRLCMIPMMITLFVAFFIAMRKEAYSKKELGLVYLLVYILLYIAGPGMYSIDYLIAQRLY